MRKNSKTDTTQQSNTSREVIKVKIHSRRERSGGTNRGEGESGRMLLPWGSGVLSTVVNKGVK